MSEVKSFKMLSGEEIVAEIVKTTPAMLVDGPTKIASYTVRRPHILQFQPIGQGQLGLAFVPWTLSNPDIQELDIPASAVLLTFSPAEKVTRQYLEQTSGIALAPAR